VCSTTGSAGWAPDEPRTNLGGDEWANEWPKNAAWDFVALRRAHDAVYWLTWLAALHVVDPDMLVNIEHEDVSLGRIEGLETASAVLLDAAGGPAFPLPRPLIVDPWVDSTSSTKLGSLIKCRAALGRPKTLANCC
jgi:hypothetical protein